MDKMKNAEKAFLSSLKADFDSLVEGRGMQKLVDQFFEDVREYMRDNMPYPADDFGFQMRSMDEEDRVESMEDHTIGRVLDQYGMGYIRSYNHSKKPRVR